MAEWWTAPFLWDPERFSPERDQPARHTFMCIPFGGGPHHCLGFKFAEFQIKAIVHQLLLRFDDQTYLSVSVQGWGAVQLF